MPLLVEPVCHLSHGGARKVAPLQLLQTPLEAFERTSTSRLSQRQCRSSLGTSDQAASPFLKAEVLLQVAMEAVEDFMRLQARARLGQQGFRQWQKQHAYKIQEVSHVVIQADTRRTYKAFVAAWVVSAAAAL